MQTEYVQLNFGQELRRQGFPEEATFICVQGLEQVVMNSRSSHQEDDQNAVGVLVYENQMQFDFK